MSIEDKLIEALIEASDRVRREGGTPDTVGIICGNCGTFNAVKYHPTLRYLVCSHCRQERRLQFMG